MKNPFRLLSMKTSINSQKFSIITILFIIHLGCKLLSNRYFVKTFNATWYWPKIKYNKVQYECEFSVISMNVNAGIYSTFTTLIISQSSSLRKAKSSIYNIIISKQSFNFKCNDISGHLLVNIWDLFYFKL